MVVVVVVVVAANLLVDYTAQHVKLADFGAAELLDKRQTLGDRATSNCGGTLHYNPPEVRVKIRRVVGMCVCASS